MDPPSLHLPLPLLYQEEIKDQADIFFIGYKQDWLATIQLSREASQIEAVAHFLQHIISLSSNGSTAHPGYFETRMEMLLNCQPR